MLLAHSFNGLDRFSLSERQPSWKESLNTSLEVIAEEPVLRALLNMIPSVGGSLNELMAGKGQQIIEKRRDNLLRLLAEHLEAIEAEAIRKDYFETPEGFDLLIKALDSSRRTRSEHKRDLIARILAGATSTDSEQGNYSPEEYVNLVASLTVKELEAARTIYDLQQNLIAEELDADNRLEIWRMCAERLKESHGIDSGDFPILVNRLHNVGLLDLYYVLTPGSPTPTYWTSTTFKRLMKFLALDA